MKTLKIALAIAALLASGGAAFNRNNALSSGITLWADVAAKSPKRARGHNNLGNALMIVGRCNEAIPSFKAAISADKWYIEPHYNLAMCLIKQSSFDDAAIELEEVIRINNILKKGHYGAQPVMRYEAQAHANLGNILNMKRMYNEAVHHYNEALKIAPDESSARFNLAFTYEQMGLIREAGMEYENVLKNNPSDEGAKRGIMRTGRW